MDIDTELTQMTLGIDRLYRAQTSGAGVLDREGLVPVALTNVQPWHFSNWTEADARLVELAARLDTIGDGLRRDYISEMVESLRGLVATFRGDAQSYVERVQRCLRVDASPVSADQMESYRGKIDRILTKIGYAQGTLGERVMRWEQERSVPPDDVTRVLRELLDIARTRTREKIFPLPPDLHIEPVGVSGVPFGAYCDYPGRQLRINLDYVYTRSALKHLACHEAFPGHLVHLAVREQRARSGEMPLDAALVVTNSASSAIFEGIGENGMYFLDWIEDDADQLAMNLNRLRSAARVNAALMIHAQGVPVDEAKTYIQEACFATPAWAESRLAFLTHRLRAPFIFAYWRGDMAVERVWRRVEPNQRPEFFRYLYHHMHTATTLDSFGTRIDRLANVYLERG